MFMSSTVELLHASRRLPHIVVNLASLIDQLLDILRLQRRSRLIQIDHDILKTLYNALDLLSLLQYPL